MSRSSPRSAPNPFYVLLLLASTAFVLTVFCYLIAPVVKQQAAEPAATARAAPGAGSLAMANWIEANAPRVIAIELAVMFATGLLAVLIEQRFGARKGGKASPDPAQTTSGTPARRGD